MKNPEVDTFLDNLNHPFRREIELLRDCILSTHEDWEENIKWNAPNYCIQGKDLITMRILPVKQLQVIFHRGAKVQTPLSEKLIKNDFSMLLWKENDRAIASFKSMPEIEERKADLLKIVSEWLRVCNE